jgi:hypothetical protein
VDPVLLLELERPEQQGLIRNEDPGKPIAAPEKLGHALALDLVDRLQDVATPATTRSTGTSSCPERKKAVARRA